MRKTPTALMVFAVGKNTVTHALEDYLLFSSKLTCGKSFEEIVSRAFLYDYGVLFVYAGLNVKKKKRK